MKSVGGLNTVVPQIGLVTEQPVQVGEGDAVGVSVGVAVTPGVGLATAVAVGVAAGIHVGLGVVPGVGEEPANTQKISVELSGVTPSQA